MLSPAMVFRLRKKGGVDIKQVMRVRRKLFWAAGILLVVLIVLPLLLIQTSAVQQWGLRRIERMARAAGISFSAKHWRLDVFRLQAVLDDVTYSDATVQARAARIAIDLPWSVLTSPVKVITDLQVDQPVVEIRSPDVVPEPSGKPTKLPKFRLEHVAVRNGSFHYSNKTANVTVPTFNIEIVRNTGTIHLTRPVDISPDVTLAIAEIPLTLSDNGVALGTINWSARYRNYSGMGTAKGNIDWSPTLAVNVSFATGNLQIDQWKNILLSGNVVFDGGVLKIPEFKAQQGKGVVTASAEISEKGNSVNLVWTDVGLAPAGVSASISGKGDLRWRAADFTDAGGNAQIFVRSPYGRAQSDVHIQNAQASLQITANGVVQGVDAAVQANVQTDLNRRLHGTFHAVSRKYGNIQVDGRLAGNIDAPIVDGGIRATAVHYQNIGPLDGSAKLAFHGNEFSLSDLQATLKQSAIRNGYVRINTQSRAIAGSVPDITLNIANVTPSASGVVKAMAMVRGTLDHPQASFDSYTTAAGVNVGGTHIDSAMVRGRFIDNIVWLDEVEARQAQGSLVGHGSLDVRSKAVNAGLQVDHFAIREIQGLSTTAVLSASVSGTLEAPDARFRGELRDVTYYSQAHGNISFDGSTHDGAGGGIRNKVASLHATSDKYKATATGDIHVSAPYEFTAKVSGNQSPVQYQLYDFAASGVVAASGQVQPFKLENVAADHLVVEGEGVKLSANGILDSGVHIDATADLSRLPVEQVVMTGNARVQAVLKGTIEDPVIDGTVQTVDATVKSRKMTEPLAFVSNISFDENRFTINDLRAEIAGGRLQIAGSGNLKGPGQIQFVATDIHPEALLPGRPVKGSITANGNVRFIKPELAGASGELTVSELNLSIRDTEIHQVEPVRLAMTDSTVTIQSFRISGSDTNAEIRGSAGIVSKSLNLDVNADTNLRILEAFVADSAVTGRLRTEASIRGSIEHPEVNGFANISNTNFQLAEPPIELADFNAEIVMHGERLEIQKATASLNGGTLTAAGGADISASGIADSDLTIHTKGVQLEYPEGLRSEINSDLQLSAAKSIVTIEGNIDIASALYRSNIDLTQEVFSRITNSSGAGPSVPPPSAFSSLRNIGLNVVVETSGPVTVANNLADLDLSGTFRIRGDLSNPVILGRAAVNEGGELYFGPAVAQDDSATIGERRDRYVINRGTIEFNNALRTEPTFDFEAEHELQAPAERYLITLRAMGTPTTLKTELTSDPYLAETDIISMLLTGRTFEELQGSQLAVAREQLANYLSGQVSGFFNAAGTALGLDTVRIDPVSLAADEDISAKLTVGKNVTRDFSIAFSQNLRGARSQAWIATYNPYRNFLVRAINETDQREFRLELRQDLRFGGGPPLPRRIAPRSEPVLGSIRFAGAEWPEKDLLKRITKPGKPFSRYRMNDDVKKLQKFYVKNDFLNVKLRARETTENGRMDVEYSVMPGERIELVYEGGSVPRKVKKEIRQNWARSFSEMSAVRDAENRLLKHFRDDGYLNAHVSHRETKADPPLDRRIVFTIDPGIHFHDPDWKIVGFEPSRDLAKNKNRDLDLLVRDVRDRPESAGEVLAAPDVVRRRIEADLQKGGFLTATASAPELDVTGEQPQFNVQVESGPQFVVSKLVFQGNTFFTAPHLQEVVVNGPTKILPDEQAARPPETEKPLEPFPFTASWVDTARQRISAEYWQQGFNDLQVVPSSQWDAKTGRATVSFLIDEGERQIIESIEINGRINTDPKYINRQFRFKRGDPVDYARINVTRKNLYDTGLFKRVEIDVVPDANDYVARVQLNENAPWRFRYGFAVANRMETSDREIGVTSDLSYGNLFGKGIALGAAVKAQQAERDVRTYASFPEFRGKKMTSTLTLFRTRDKTIPQTTQYFLGFTAQQQRRLSDYYLLTYDYSYQRVHALGPKVNPLNPADTDFSYNISRFNAALTRDTRDDILNATRGTFFSNSFEFAPPGLGTTFKYIKDYAQYFRFRPLKKNLVWASGYRAGLAFGLGSPDLVPAEQFLTGGGTTLRGFRQDQLSLEPGNGLLIMNQELRFPIFWKIGGVAFFDAGNIYRDVQNVRPWVLRYSPGFGLRIQTPLILLRIDMGLNLANRAGEPPRRIVFGIGQAF